MRRIAVVALLLAALPRPARADLATGTGDVTTGGATETGGDSDDADTGETMPPVYEPCGCRSAGEGAWGLLALVALIRRRR